MKPLFFVSLLAISAALSAQELPVGAKVPDFQVVDLDGKPLQIRAANGVTVITFVSTQCPVSNAYNERMNAIYKDYSAKGVHFVFVNSNRNESPVEVREHVAQHKLDYKVFKDPNNVIADRFNAQVTPESYVLDSTGTLRYHGSLDDSREIGRVKDQRLRKALDAVIAGKPVESAETKAFGCTIKRASKAS